MRVVSLEATIKSAKRRMPRQEWGLFLGVPIVGGCKGKPKGHDFGIPNPKERPVTPISSGSSGRDPGGIAEAGCPGLDAELGGLPGME